MQFFSIKGFFLGMLDKKKNISGILLLDKPKFVTSNFALQKIKRIFNAKKAGHTGSLDPLASGMLPILFGKATKYAKYLLNATKYYHVIAKLGEKTVTGDLAGLVISNKRVSVSMNQIIQVLKKFCGIIHQVPPMYSAIKYHGIPLYKYARKGINLFRVSRELKIFELRLLQYTCNLLELKIKCSKGTYIRSLIEDIGDELGCGAHVVFLRRIGIEPYISNKLITFSDINIIHSKNFKKKKFDLFKIFRFLLPITSLISKYKNLN